MKPLIKWPGGKAREYKNIKNITPKDINTYIEPFFGGGGIYFNLEPKQFLIGFLLLDCEFCTTSDSY
jgi:DNA adenine methylase